MIIELGRHTIECDFDPTIHNNASRNKVPIEDIGFIYNCVYKQKDAFIHSVEAIREVYPDSKIRHLDPMEYQMLLGGIVATKVFIHCSQLPKNC